MALTRPTTSPGKASSTVSRSGPNAVVAYFVVRSRPVRWLVTLMPRSKRPEQMRANAMRSRCDGSMLACTLNTKAENGLSSGRGSSTAVEPRRWRRREVDDGVEQQAHAEVGERRADEHRRRLTGEERRQVDVGADASSSEHSSSAAFHAVPCSALPASLAAPTSVVSSAAADAPRAVRVNRVNSPRAAVDHAAEVAADADRPRRPASGAARSAPRSRRAARAARGRAGRTC